MTGSADGGRSRRYPVVLAILFTVVVGLAAASLFVATGGSLFGWSGGIFGTGSKPPLEATLERAREDAAGGRYDAALAAFDTVVAAAPDDRDLAVERARVLGWAQRYGEAADALAAVEDTTDVETTLERARYLWWAGRALEADSLLSALLARHPGVEEARSLQDLIRPGIEPGVDVARRWVDERPDDPFARLRLARALVEAGRSGPSLAHYRAALGVRGTVEPDVLLEAAGVALGVDSLRFAGELLLRYLEDVDPSDRVTRLRLARAYSWDGRWTAAAEQYREILAVVPDPEIRLELARMLVNAGRYDAAVTEYRRVLAARPSLAARRELASALAQLERYDLALRELDRVIEQDPDPALLLRKVELLALQERYSEAADALGRLLERQPEAHHHRLERARYLWWSGRLTEADAELTRLLAARPEDEEARGLREDIRAGIDVSVEMARTWVELDDTPRNRLRLARLLGARDRYAEALPHYRAALADSATRELVVEAVEVAEATDSLDAAIGFLGRWLDPDDPDPALLLRLARLHSWAGRPAVAAEIYGRYLALAPGDVDARFERARQLAWQDSTVWDSAAAELERVVAAEPAHAPALKLLGDLQRWRGRPNRALAYYRRAEAADPEVEGLTEGIELATAMAEEAAARRDATYVAWAADADAFTDSEEFGWVAVSGQRSWRLGRTVVGVTAGPRYARGVDLAGAADGAFGVHAGVLGEYRIRSGLVATAAAGVAAYSDVGASPTWGAGVEYADSVTLVRARYDREPGVREATTMAALQAEAALDRLLLRALYSFGDWQAAADLQLQAFSADAGDTDRYAGTVRLDRALGGGWTAGALVRGIFATDASPADPDWGPLLWAPVRYVAPAVSVGYGAPVADGWWVGLRASPGYAFIEERAGLARYATGETAVLEAGATVAYRRGPWSLSLSGDWGGAIPDGYRASTIRIELTRIGDIP